MSNPSKVLFCQRYSLTSKETGELVQGCKIQVVGSEAIDDESYRGLPVISYSAPYKIWSKFKSLPGDYNLNIVTLPNGKQRLIDASPVEG